MTLMATSYLDLFGIPEGKFLIDNDAFVHITACMDIESVYLFHHAMCDNITLCALTYASVSLKLEILTTSTLQCTLALTTLCFNHDIICFIVVCIDMSKCLL